jgi:hypothetical protein
MIKKSTQRIILVCLIIFTAFTVINPIYSIAVSTVTPKQTAKPDPYEKYYVIKGDVSLKIDKNKAIITFKSNLYDGTIVQMRLSNYQKLIFDFVPSKAGIAKKEFIIPNDWIATCITACSQVPFGWEDHPQPKKVCEVYGSYGDKVKGAYWDENNTPVIRYETKDIIYPNESFSTVAKLSKRKSLSREIKDDFAYNFLAHDFGQDISITGQIIEISKVGKVYECIVATSKVDNKWSSNEILLHVDSHNLTMFLQKKNIICIWGTVDKAYTYTSNHGLKVSIPKINAFSIKAISIN